MKYDGKFKINLVVTGFSGFIAQIILFRELLTAFYGNEFSIGIILSFWLVCEAIGAYSGEKIKKLPKKITYYYGIQIVFPVFLLFSVFFTKIFRLIINIPYGIMLNFKQMFFISFITIFPTAFIHGFLFTYSYRIIKPKEKTYATYVYGFETIGNIIAALMITYFLFPKFDSATICSILFLIAFLNIANLSCSKKIKILSTTASAIIFLAILGGLPSFLNKKMISQQWKPQRIIINKNSPFGTITAASLNEQINIFYNATLQITLPYKNTQDCETVIHIPLLYVNNPKNILIMGKTFGGYSNELLKYKNIGIDILQIDPVFIEICNKLCKKFNLKTLCKELKSKKTRIILKDPIEFFTQKNQKKYDAVFVLEELPSDLQTARFYTKEFFKKAKNFLKKDGILICTIPSKTNFMSNEMAFMNAVLYNTMKETFNWVKTIPGEKTIIIGFKTKPKKDIKNLQETFRKRNLKLNFLTQEYLNIKLEKFYEDWYLSNISKIKNTINTNNRPILCFASQLYKASYYGNKNILKRIFKIKKNTFLKFFAIFAVLIYFLILISEKFSSEKTSLIFPIYTTGILSISINILTILIFQIAFGYMILWVSILIASLMAGIAIGSIIISKKFKNVLNFNSLIALQLLMVFPFITLFFIDANLHFAKLKYALITINIIFGILQGIEFALINKFYFEISHIEKSGKIYSFDLLGGFVGGILTPIVIIPLYGIKFLIMLMIGLKTLTVVLLYLNKTTSLKRKKLFFILIFFSLIPLIRINASEKKEKEAMFYEKLGNNLVKCQLCPHKCILPDGIRGLCKVRLNKGGTLYTLIFGKPCTVTLDIIEKAPFYHFLPGSKRLCVATAGCNMKCLYCQNWQISQSYPEDITSLDYPPKKLVETAKKLNLKILCFTYSEPVIFYEYMYESSKLAQRNNIKTAMVSNGFINPEPLKKLLPYMTAVKIDLKSFSEEFYEKICGGHLKDVLNTLKVLKNQKKHFEIVVLLIPTLNDSTVELTRMCKWIHNNLGDDVPLHFIRFMPSYKLTNIPMTPVSTLEKARKIAKTFGINYVYIGNVPGHKYNSTFCPNCGKMLIHRKGFSILEFHIKDGKCEYCGTPIPGIWK